MMYEEVDHERGDDQTQCCIDTMKEGNLFPRRLKLLELVGGWHVTSAWSFPSASLLSSDRLHVQLSSCSSDLLDEEGR